jgi:hypothetical protein
MIIDHPHVLRSIVKEHKPKANDEGAKKLVGEYADFLDDYLKNLKLFLILFGKKKKITGKTPKNKPTFY